MILEKNFFLMVDMFGKQLVLGTSFLEFPRSIDHQCFLWDRVDELDRTHLDILGKSQIPLSLRSNFLHPCGTVYF